MNEGGRGNEGGSENEGGGGERERGREEGGRDGNRGEGFVPLEGAKLYAMVEIPTLLTLLEIN